MGVRMCCGVSVRVLWGECEGVVGCGGVGVRVCGCVGG